jgi:hypothetical protein
MLGLMLGLLMLGLLVVLVVLVVLVLVLVLLLLLVVVLLHLLLLTGWGCSLRTSRKRRFHPGLLWQGVLTLLVRMLLVLRLQLWLM